MRGGIWREQFLYRDAAVQPPPSVQSIQQQSHSNPSGTASAVLSQAGGKSSKATSRAGLKNLKWCRVSPIQNTTTVSSGGQPGRPQVISVTRMVASAASVKRSRVQSR